MAKALAHFTITRSGEDYLLSFEDEEGDTHEFTASFEILDLITEAIEEQLDVCRNIVGDENQLGLCRGRFRHIRAIL